jgi:ATP-dependent Lhr-like helicase
MGTFMALERFHPAVSRWFEGRFGALTPAQAAAWPHIKDGRHTLVAAPTGSGKTLCAFLSAIDDLVRRGQDGELPDELGVLYVSPLKALSTDIEKNLQEPLRGIREALARSGSPDVDIRTAVRTGDTTPKDRAAAVKRPPHIFVTTPESLYVLLTSDGGRRMLRTVRTVIVDEIHALVRDKRGAHLALSLERLDQLAGRRVQRIGLSATQKPIEEVARFLVGARDASAGARRAASVARAADGQSTASDCVIIDEGHRRALDLAICVPGSPLEAVMSAEVWSEVYDQIAALVGQHKTTLIFTNTRRMAERVTRFLSERLGEAAVTSHHGSLARAQRFDAEQRLKSGQLRALVATASLELGIDVGDVELVCQLGSPGSIATWLQRVGRSGHFVGGTPKGRLFPLSRDDLVECAALLDASRRGELDQVDVPLAPLDILAQQIVATLVPEEQSEDELFSLVRRAYPYRALERKDFDAVVHMLAEGFTTSRGRRGAYVHHDAVGRRLRARRAARLAALTNGGAIPDNFDYDVVIEPTETRVGSVHEDFAIESMPGDIFQLGNTSYEIIKVDPGKVRVTDAGGRPPTIPFWLGEAPSRTDELSHAVSRLRSRVDESIEEDQGRAYLATEVGLPNAAVEQIADYLAATRNALGVMPTQQALVAERFFDETGGMHVVLHAPYGSRLTRALGLALRKRFCRSFNVELQAAASEDALVLSLGPMHSFPLETLFQFLQAKSARDVLAQALLDAPLFQTRWRWNVTRALAVLRFRGGKKVAPRFQRMESDDLLALCFPDQVACLENIAGDREIPDHPLVQQTIYDALHEAMDVDGLERLLSDIEAGRIACFARDLTEPSPLSQEILNARPYAFLDDAPLEERRTQAVMMRRWLDPESASDIGALDVAAIEQVVAEARPDPRDADELHDALVVHGCLPENEGHTLELEKYLEPLRSARRAARLHTGVLVDGEPRVLWIPAERLRQWRAVYPDARLEPELTAPERLVDSQPAPPSRDQALVELVRGRLEMVGPATLDELWRALGVPREDLAVALASLESEGFILRGRFRPAEGEEVCERRLLARIHRYTLGKLRREIEPVPAATFLRFLFRWQGLETSFRREGLEGLNATIEQLAGFEAAAGAWEADLLPARLKLYDPSWLDALCLAGRVTWARRSAPAPAPGKTRRSGPVRTTPIALMPRAQAELWLPETFEVDGLSSNASRVHELLVRRGASFFDDLVRGSGLLRTQAEEALGELVAHGLVTSDAFAGLRTLITPAEKRRPSRRTLVSRGFAPPLGLSGSARAASSVGMEGAGRFSLLVGSSTERDVEALARTLLLRWGVVFRKVLERESGLVTWRELLRVYHRLEARGEIRGGRFVVGFSGEQFALPEAVGTLRKLRREEACGQLVSVSGADPLNLVGILTSDERVPSVATSRVLYADGVPLALRDGRTTRVLDVPRGRTESELERALLRSPAQHPTP